MTEDRWIQEIVDRFQDGVVNGDLGPGDDAAVITPPPGHSLVFTVDAMVEGTHFRSSWLTNSELGSRVVRVSLSDLAAMGAIPSGLLLSIATPDLPGHVGTEFWDGIEATLREFGLALWGGNVTRTDGPLEISSTVVGTVPIGQEVRRSGARPGHALWVTGHPGSTAVARRALDSDQRDQDLTRPFRRPEPRIAIASALRERGTVSAAIDISDGLGIDAVRMLRASGVGAELDLQSLARENTIEDIIEGGEDYELFFACPGDRELDAAQWEAEFDVPLTRVGTATEDKALWIRTDRGREEYTPRGWDPFS